MLGESLLLPDPRQLRTTTDTDEAIDLIGAALWPHRLKVHDGGSTEVARYSALELGDCALVHVQYGRDVEIDAGCIADFFLVKSVLATGEGAWLRCGTRTVASSPRRLMVTSTATPTSIRMTSACRHLTTRISRAAVERRLVETLGRPLTHPLEFDIDAPVDGDFGRAWVELLMHVCHLSATAPRVLENPQVRAQYARTLIELLVHAGPHSYSQVLQDATPRATPRHVRRACEYIHAHLSGLLSVVEIAHAIGVTPRTLQNGFRQALGLTPAEYIRRARLQALHAALLRADPSASVTELMTAHGIANFGRYARYYRQQYGVPPSTTLRDGRAAH
jgi:AraC-like DNA-binding protein